MVLIRTPGRQKSTAHGELPYGDKVLCNHQLELLWLYHQYCKISTWVLIKWRMKIKRTYKHVRHFRQPLLLPFLWGTFFQNSSMPTVGFALFHQPASSVSVLIFITCTSLCIPSASTSSSKKINPQLHQAKKKCILPHSCKLFFLSFLLLPLSGWWCRFWVRCFIESPFSSSLTMVALNECLVGAKDAKKVGSNYHDIGDWWPCCWWWHSSDCTG